MSSEATRDLRWKELAKWAENKESFTLEQRRFIDGEIHCLLFNIPHCEWFNQFGVAGHRRCKNAWPASCSEGRELPYRTCGAGLHGSYISGVWVDRAPRYIDESYSPEVVAAILRELNP